jgi:hypothetical protein
MIRCQRNCQREIARELLGVITNHPARSPRPVALASGGVGVDLGVAVMQRLDLLG